MAAEKNRQDDIYRTMVDLANFSQEYLSEPPGRPWRNEVEKRLRAAIDHAMKLIQEVGTESDEARKSN